jgi:hypothetical protein
MGEKHTGCEWIVPRSLADMPAKPGVESYEYVDCLILYRGELLMRPWNCEHHVFDDEQHDDFFCDWPAVQAYRSLSGEEAAARAAIAAATPTDTKPAGEGGGA